MYFRSGLPPWVLLPARGSKDRTRKALLWWSGALHDMFGKCSSWSDNRQEIEYADLRGEKR